MKDTDKSKEQLIAELEQLRLAHHMCEISLKDSTQSEKMLQDIFDHNPMSMQILDKNGFTISVNQAFVELFGVSPTPDVPMFGDSQLVGQGLKPFFDRFQQGEVVKFPGASYNAHLKKPEFPDKEVWVEAVGFPIFDSRGFPERYVIMHVDLTERKQREVMLANLNEQLRLMTAYNEEVREDERKKLARELHDDFGTPLSAINMRLGTLKDTLTDAQAVAEMNRILAFIGNTQHTLQRMLSGLRSVIIDDLGIEMAVKAYVDDFSESNKMKVYLDMDADLQLDYETSFVVYKILQGALSNVARHAEADTVDMWLNRVGDHLEFIISDNGIGIEADQIVSNKSFGIIGMKERVEKLEGSFEICRGSDRGTTITIHLPLKEPEKL